MKKKQKFTVFFLMIFLALNTFLCAQDAKYDILEKTKVNLTDVEDIKLNKSEYTIVTTDKIHTANLQGVITQSHVKNNIKGISHNWNSKDIVSIESSNTIQQNGNELKYLAKQKNNSFSCKLFSSGEGESWSNQIVLLNNTSGEEKFFTYIPGKPSGLYCDQNYVWYIANKTKKDENGIVMIYDLTTGELISEEIIPVQDPKGIDFDNDGNLVTYSSSTNEIIKLRRSKK